ncbi:threonine synthase [Paramicrosporidium saccamoebae]|uniref:Threonine synthase n=1 Tax=Paramicrosporidium saccamoebae TaxID=1246581 RepID=A0A2H9TH47_9FUNG|nr:threonine synthase [Paramicrosporidium saccamoebae]
MPHSTPRLVSTRGSSQCEDFTSLKVQGLCPENGGLYVPSHFPHVGLPVLESWRGYSFPVLAQAVLSLYLPETTISTDDLKRLLEKSFSTFEDERVTPIVTIDANFHLLELYRGPTLSFKDIALQFLGNFLEYLVQKQTVDKPVVVLGATSGDTGSAAIAGLEGKTGIKVVILYPEGRVSLVQELQMITGNSANVTCLACPGSFDECQTLVKEAFADKDVQARFQLLGINSINIVRILVQTVYYFYSYLRLAKKIGDSIDYSVPTGNFGDILAGYYAKRMGLPLGQLVIAANCNDILPRFLNTGTYSLNNVVPTISPSMDIQISSNFERYLYELSGRNSEQVATWMHQLNTEGSFSVSSTELAQARRDFSGYVATRDGCLETIAQIARRSEGTMVLDPHSAIGVSAAIQARNHDIPIVSLATAHPAKFPDAVSKALDTVGIKNSPWLSHPSITALVGREKNVGKLSMFTLEALLKYL